MTVGVEINGVTLVPIKDAAVAVSYSRDYVSRLAREGKIVASQIGRQWFVDLASLQNFSKSAELQDEVRKKDLRVERKIELKTKEALDVLNTLTAEKVKGHHLDAVGVSFVTLCLGFLVGTSIYASSHHLDSSSSAFVLLDTLTESSISLLPETSHNRAMVSESLPLARVDKPQETLLLTSITEKPVFLTEAETRAMGLRDGVLVFGANEISDAEDVEALFSDDVTVTFTDANSGMIKYQKASGAEVEYPFVSVPETVDIEKESEVMPDKQ